MSSSCWKYQQPQRSKPLHAPPLCSVWFHRAKIESGVGQGPHSEGQHRGYGPGRAELVGMSRPGQRPANTLSQGQGPREPVTLLTEEREVRQGVRGLRPVLCLALGCLSGGLLPVPRASQHNHPHPAHFPAPWLPSCMASDMRWNPSSSHFLINSGHTVVARRMTS